MAANAAAGNIDYYASFGHNYYLYEVTPGRFTMLPWDMNFSQEVFDHPCGAGRNTREFPVSFYLLGNRAMVQRYGEILTDILEGAGSAEAQIALLDHARSLLGSSGLTRQVYEERRRAIETRVDRLKRGLENLRGCPR